MFLFKISQSRANDLETDSQLAESVKAVIDHDLYQLSFCILIFPMFVGFFCSSQDKIFDITQGYIDIQILIFFTFSGPIPEFNQMVKLLSFPLLLWWCLKENMLCSFEPKLYLPYSLVGLLPCTSPLINSKYVFTVELDLPPNLACPCNAYSMNY